MELRFAVRAIGNGGRGLRSVFLLFLVLNFARGAEETCSAPSVDCEFFGCFPPASECPPDCDTFEAPESCHAVRSADGRQACRFNPQYSFGRGLCQKDVTCYDLGYGQCSKDCFHCGYFGCLPSGTNCPAYCEELDSLDCERMGGVAGGMACQWNSTSEVCEAAPLAQLSRVLSPSPLLAHPALAIRDGATITPSDYPGVSSAPAPPTAPTPAPAPLPSPPPEPLDWAGAQGSPGRQAFYVGSAFALIGLISVTAFLCSQRSMKSKRNRILAAGLPAGEQRALFHRESLLVHIRRAVAQLGQFPTSAAAVQHQSSTWPPPAASSSSSSGVKSRPMTPDADFSPPGTRAAPYARASFSSSLLPRKPSAIAPVDIAIKSSFSGMSGSSYVGQPLYIFAEDAEAEQIQQDDDLFCRTTPHDDRLNSP